MDDPHDKYRDAARLILASVAGASVEQQAHVKLMTPRRVGRAVDSAGAFVEAVIWVPVGAILGSGDGTDT